MYKGEVIARDVDLEVNVKWILNSCSEINQKRWRHFCQQHSKKWYSNKHRQRLTKEEGPRNSHIRWKSWARVTSWTHKRKRGHRRQRIWRWEQPCLLWRTKCYYYRDPFKERWMKLSIHATHLTCWTLVLILVKGYRKLRKRRLRRYQWILLTVKYLRSLYELSLQWSGVKVTYQWIEGWVILIMTLIISMAMYCYHFFKHKIR